MNSLNAYKIVEEFEKRVAEFAGSKFAVAVDNCTNALFLSCKYLKIGEVTIPSRTYPSVPCAIINAGGKVGFEDVEWRFGGYYRLKPYPIYDAAHYFLKDMFNHPSPLCRGDDLSRKYMCISFSATKPINIGKGGMILTNDENSVDWFRKARYCGRNNKPIMDDSFDLLGWNMYMTPEQAARGLLLMHDIKGLKKTLIPDYPDLSKYEVYK